MRTDGKTDRQKCEVVITGTRVYASVRASVRLSSRSTAAVTCGWFAAEPHAARRCYGFAAVGPTARVYRSTAARPAVSSSCAAARRAAATAGNATLSADVQKAEDRFVSLNLLDARIFSSIPQLFSAELIEIHGVFAHQT